MKKAKKDKKHLLYVVQAEKALKDAVRKTIEDHARTNDPIVVWKNGKVTWVSAKKLLAREPQAEYGVKKKKKKR